MIGLVLVKLRAATQTGNLITQSLQAIRKLLKLIGDKITLSYLAHFCLDT